MTEQIITSAGSRTLDLGELYRQHHARLLRAARRLGLDHEAAQDLVQASFLAAHRRIEDFEGTADPYTWLYAILFNHYRNHRRALERARLRTEALSLRDADGPQHRHQVDASYLADQLLAALSAQQRALLCLWLGAGMSVREVAGELGLNTNTAYSQIRAALLRARSMIEADPANRA
jgi:RNA polymerase sigma-70 factor (ECF subfamily)